MIGLFLGLTMIWGGSFLAIAWSVETFPPLFSASMRILMAMFGFAILAWVKRGAGWHKIPRKDMLSLGLIGLGNFGVAWAFLFWGEQHVPAGLASILNASTPLFVFLISTFALSKTDRTGLEILGAIIGFLGVATVFYPAIVNVHQDRLFLQGMLAVLVMAIAYGFGAAYTKKWGNKYPLGTNLFYQTLPSGLGLLLLSVLFEKPWHAFAGPDLVKPAAALLYLGLVSTFFAWIIYHKLLMGWGPIKATAVTYLVPFVALSLDWWAVGRWPDAHEQMGILLIVSGVLTMHRHPILLQSLQRIFLLRHRALSGDPASKKR